MDRNNRMAGWQDGSSRVRAPRSMNRNERGNGLRGRWRRGRPFPSVFQAAGASDGAAAQVIFAILSILSILSLQFR